MKPMRSAALGLAGCLLAGAPAALAGEAASAPDAVAATPQVREAFRPVATGSVMHIQSGMTCHGGGDSLRLARVQVFGPRALGEDVGCDYSYPGGAITVVAMRSPGLPAAALADAVVARIRTQNPGAQPASPPAIPPARTLVSPQTASFLVDAGGRPTITSVWLAVERDWVVEVRASYGAERRDEPELVAAILSLAARESIIKAAVTH